MRDGGKGERERGRGKENTSPPVWSLEKMRKDEFDPARRERKEKS